MIQNAIIKIIEGVDLDESEAYKAMEAIMGGRASPVQIGAFLTALKMKGEKVQEIAGFAKAMRKAAQTIGPFEGPVVDTCGTGGDRKGTFNISTVAAFVAAGAGCKVAKHGNRSMTSKCGSADLLEGLGIDVGMPIALVAESIEETGIGFLFAPSFHPAMRHAAGPRKEVGFRTVFNLLGPLTNPAGARAQLMGVFDEKWTEPLAHVLMRLGVERALVVHGSDGLDEITLFGPTMVSELKGGAVSSFLLDAASIGLKTDYSPDSISGGDVQTNVAIALDVLKGKPGACRDIVLANAGAAIYCAGLASDLAEGVELAGESIDSGAAFKALERLRSFCKRSPGGRG